MLTVDGGLVNVCQKCGFDLGEEPVDPESWNDESDGVEHEVAFRPAAEVETGP